MVAAAELRPVMVPTSDAVEVMVVTQVDVSLWGPDTAKDTSLVTVLVDILRARG